MIDLSAIRARAEAATKGPWRSVLCRGSRGGRTHLLSDDDREIAAQGLTDPREEGRANMEFLAHARADIPALLEEVERLRALVRGAHSDGGCPWCDRHLYDTAHAPDCPAFTPDGELR